MCADCEALIETLSRQGVQCRPVTASALVMNKQLYRQFKRQSPKQEEGGLQYRASEKSHAIWLGGRESGAVRHVVALVDGAGGTLLVDPSLDQANRPEKNTKGLSTLVADTSGPFLRGEERRVYERRGCGLAYELHPRDHWYEAAPDWNDAERLAELTRLLQSGRR